MERKEKRKKMSATLQTLNRFPRERSQTTKTFNLTQQKTRCRERVEGVGGGGVGGQIFKPTDEARTLSDLVLYTDCACRADEQRKTDTYRHYV
jgi:hypothetical protein